MNFKKHTIINMGQLPDLTTVIVIEKQLNLLNFYVTFKNKTVDDKSSLCFFE